MDQLNLQRHHRGTRRQQRYRAQQKLMERDAEVHDTKSVVLPAYLNVPNRVFRQMFLAASEHVLSSDGMKSMHQWLNVSTNMQSAREQARLLDRLLYLKQQQSLWADYFHVGSQYDVWASEVQDKMSGQTKSALQFVADYRQGIREQLERTQSDLDDRQCQTHADVTNILTAFIRKGQQRLTAEFQCKKRLLNLDCQDHRLTKAFFGLTPTKQQVKSARTIWSATLQQHMAEERVTMLKHRLSVKVLPRSFDALDQSLDDLNRDLRQTVIDGNTRTTISGRRQKIIGQMKLDMMAIDISVAEAAARGHSNRVKEEHEKLLLNGGATDDVIHAVQARQDNISRRAHYVTSCKVSFFDETPMMQNESTARSIIGV
jgi:hypothetical protein